mmetsp:Transcript_37932/g.93024  ORF Transcript_37932/g.93024 Transcript_37932/m.93024 type:complete len:258 (+) Transcript_37932:185-958(+)
MASHSKMSAILANDSSSRPCMLSTPCVMLMGVWRILPSFMYEMTANDVAWLERRTRPRSRSSCSSSFSASCRVWPGRQYDASANSSSGVASICLSDTFMYSLADGACTSRIVMPYVGARWLSSARTVANERSLSSLDQPSSAFVMSTWRSAPVVLWRYDTHRQPGCRDGRTRYAPGPSSRSVCSASWRDTLRKSMPGSVMRMRSSWIWSLTPPDGVHWPESRRPPSFKCGALASDGGGAPYKPFACGIVAAFGCGTP